MGISLNDLRKSGATPESLGTAGDGEAFERFYAEHAEHVRQVVRRYLWGAVVDDVVQEAFAQAYRSRLHLDGEDRGRDPARLLVGIARNRSIDVLRQRIRGGEEIADDGRLAAMASPVAEFDPESGFLAARRREGIAEALDALCARQRRVLSLRHLEGLSYDEIAERERMTADAVKATLARGRKSFRHMYAAIAEREGLSVLVGGGAFRRVLDRIRSGLRGARERLAAGYDAVAANVAAVSPGMTNTLVAAFVAGSVTVLGAGAAAASENPDADGAAALAAAMESYSATLDATQEVLVAAEEDAEADGEAEPESEDRGKGKPSEDEPAAEGPSEEAGGASTGNGAPVAAQASTSASASADSDEVAPDDTPASGGADAEATAEADTEEGHAETEHAASAEGDADLVTGVQQTSGSYGIGCSDGNLSAVLCPVLAP